MGGNIGWRIVHGKCERLLNMDRAVEEVDVEGVGPHEVVIRSPSEVLRYERVDSHFPCFGINYQPRGSANKGIVDLVSHETLKRLIRCANVKGEVG